MEIRFGDFKLSVDPKVLKRAIWAVVVILALLLWFALTLLGYAPTLPIALSLP